MMTKKEARSHFRQLREGLGPRQRERAQDLLLIRFRELRLPFLHTLHTYLPMHHLAEPDPEPLVRSIEFSNPGLRIAVPRIISDTEMANIRMTEHTELLRNEFGILEPQEGELIDPLQFDLVLVPLLGYDLRGNRVGYGKGYYDRFLAGCRGDVLKLGLSFFGPIDKIDDTGLWDIPLDYCITPEKVYEF
jgi:5-formyltetrahydrofolate cyclo-ligase